MESYYILETNGTENKSESLVNETSLTSILVSTDSQKDKHTNIKRFQPDIKNAVNGGKWSTFDISNSLRVRIFSSENP